MDKKIITKLNELQNKAIVVGTNMELSENANAHQLLSDLVSDVVDDTNEILGLLNKDKA
ncbi:hypothetical protein OZX58_03210 [Lactobacillus sp. ESL0680]|uniref:hypothetical protein n=1 Tax=Lactobacillus sp. ESL0680 TaxID=2983210 RepID=UPI0023F69844|nr:hypothetical protein [Lactobacillus sp. ESL0680]WEV39259.1 hypothetical protein OZX58_03210 [Lactobacillus sp. ESL0680]